MNKLKNVSYQILDTDEFKERISMAFCGEGVSRVC